ncbi:MAG: putative membrane protein [Halioglobus sp.]|jgi:uncharacterized membrane protein
MIDLSYLIIGVLLFAVVHLVPSMAPGVKASWLGKMGESGYKGTFSLLLLASFALIIIGWRSAQPSSIYIPTFALRETAMGLLVIAVGFLVVGSRNSRVRQWVRHPQLTGLLLWAIAHLLLNGDSRSVTLFGGMATWSFIEMLVISKREGAWVKSEVPTVAAELLTVVITVVAVAAIVWGHAYLSGVPLYANIS